MDDVDRLPDEVNEEVTILLAEDLVHVGAFQVPELDKVQHVLRDQIQVREDRDEVLGHKSFRQILHRVHHPPRRPLVHVEVVRHDRHAEAFLERVRQLPQHLAV